MRISLSIKELLPLIAEKYKFKNSSAGFTEIFYIHPDAKMQMYEPKTMAYLGKATAPISLLSRVNILEMHVEDILRLADGFMPEKDLINYLSNYLTIEEN